MLARFFVLSLLGASLMSGAALAQTSPPSGEPGLNADAPRQLIIREINVEGVEDVPTRLFIHQTSGLVVGQEVQLPGDPAFAEAIRSIYRLGLYSDVRILDEEVEDGTHLTIVVRQEPLLGEFSIEGTSRRQARDLREKLPLIPGRPVRPGDVERSVQIIEEFFEGRGFRLVDVDVRRSVRNDRVNLSFAVNAGTRIRVGDIEIEGNQQFSDARLRGQMKNTRQNRWWRFWNRGRFDEAGYQEDLDNIIDFYNQRGFFDAHIVSDTTYIMRNGAPQKAVRIELHEGNRFFIRDVDWEGNTVYTDEFLSNALGLEPGDVFNSRRLEQNLFGNRQQSDISALYMNRGYMRFNVQPNIRVSAADSLDLHFDLFEGDLYDFGNIVISGNTKTNEHVIRRELYTVPGERFSREAIQESIRRLGQLNYFNMETLAAGPRVDIDEDRRMVDLVYNVEETGGDQLELSGTWGRWGLVLQLRFSFNNFSAQNMFNREAWRPLPAGDGQRLSMSVQTNGRYYQSYSLSFTEPWLRGRPTPTGFALSYSRIGRNPYAFSLQDAGENSLSTFSSRFFYDQRLRWPDDKFGSSTGIRYQFYDNQDLIFSLPTGISQEITLEQRITRNSLDNPLFPRSGSYVQASLEVAPPIPGFIQYHKWRLQNNWNIPLANRLTFTVGTDHGYIGSLTGDPVQFQRFIVGGSPFETQGAYTYFGSDIVFMRGYPAGVLGPRLAGDPVGGTILNKYTSELRWMAVTSPQLQAAPYLFVDAANTWNDFRSYNPAALYRSAGVGARLVLPIVGMIEVTYGYNFDQFLPINQRHDGSQRWYFQFSLGQGFGL
jgi:outer membrane protein insertion porin family